MTTKYRIAEEVLLELKKRGYDGKLTLQEIMLKVGRGLAYLARNRYFVTKQIDVADIDGSLIYTFPPQSVLTDAVTGEYYVTLPATTMTFQHGLGVRQVSPTNNPLHEYYPVTNGFNGLYRGLMASTLEGNIGYYPDNDKIKFVNMTSMNKADSVYMKLVLPLDGIDDDASLNIPMDMQEECITYIVQGYLPVAIKDPTPDNK